MKKVFYFESATGGGTTIVPGIPPKPKGVEQPFSEEEKPAESLEIKADEDKENETDTGL